MKEDIHPKSHPACFIDVSTGTKFITRSTKKTKKTEVIDGVEHFVHMCDVTGASHPSYTGKTRLVDTAGRIQKFEKKFARKR